MGITRHGLGGWGEAGSGTGGDRKATQREPNRAGERCERHRSRFSYGSERTGREKEVTLT